MSGADDIQRSVLPIRDETYGGVRPLYIQDAPSFPPIAPMRPPKGAPNVLVILLDDVGFGASSAFGDRSRRPTSRSWRRTG